MKIERYEVTIVATQKAGISLAGGVLIKDFFSEAFIIKKEEIFMEKLIPEKLKKGDEIRIIAPSISMLILKKDCIDTAIKRLETEGFKVTFGKNVMDCFDEDYTCGSIEKRVEDLEEAFKDKNVKAILTVIGGYNSNQLLDYINYDLIKENPKILCGFSDITALLDTIYAKTGLITYYGPHFSSFGMKKGFEYTLEYFKKIFMEEIDNIKIRPSKEWSNDSWFKEQEKRTFIKNDGYLIINEGVTEGEIIGGNLCTLNLLQGTEYMPDMENKILFLEDDELVGKEFLREFDRDLESLLQTTKNIKGIIIGRAEKNSEMTNEKWIKLIKNKAKLKDIPVIANADFGHTTPIFTFPIGGYAKIEAINGNVRIQISNKK